MKPEERKIQNGTFFHPSKFLGREMPFYAIFPVEYNLQPKEFPVLYLLHGLFGSFENWLENTDILKYAAHNSLVVICAQGDDGWYTDSTHVKNSFYQSYFWDELLPFVENKFRIKKNGATRMIAGLSMGGYGALKYVFRRPDMFGFAASMSGAFDAPEFNEDARLAELKPTIDAVFAADQNLRRQENLFQILNDKSSAVIPDLPFIYFDCGIDDPMLESNLKLEKALAALDIPHEFEICPGGHDWNYWNRQLNVIFKKINLLLY